MNLMRTLARAWAFGLVALLAACGGGSRSDTVEATSAPSLEILSNVPGTATGNVTLRFRFSADVAAFASGTLPFALSGGSQVSGSFTKVSAREYTVVIAPNTNSTGVIELTVPAGAFFDASNTNASTTAYRFSQPYDTAVASNEPVPAFTSSASGIATAAFTLTIDWNVDVGGNFTVGDLLVGDATASEFTQVTARQFTVTLTPPADSTGIAIVTIPASAVANLNTGTATVRDHSFAVFYVTP